MYLAKVRGTVVSTQKDSRLVGYKLLITQRIDTEGAYIDKPNVSVDTVGAGVGEIVIVTTGSSARYASVHQVDPDTGRVGHRDGSSVPVSHRVDSPVDSTIVGIVDSTEVDA